MLRAYPDARVVDEHVEPPVIARDLFTERPHLLVERVRLPLAGREIDV